jgi:hypothetical protein
MTANGGKETYQNLYRQAIHKLTVGQAFILFSFLSIIW